ncbi:multiple inositol polyphosphate phosphatase 1-like isoform X2 [Sipha flava]|uniref:Multiple inositol polyphosphate phosphatase 1 n=1 Tax=Sipha flava TaxID=143950 RepID=A0A8B8FMZ9_9HEMI|nr:multiple inositol polyphosphate phosphatase 1-like isoform X2 [Sipha flava]
MCHPLFLFQNRVIVSQESRCKESASIFLKEAFQTDIDEINLEKMNLNDPRFYLNDQIKTVTDFEKNFLNGPEINKMIDNVTRILGLDNPLDFKTVNAMHDSCRHRKARYINYDSPWCAVFTDDDLKVFEYYYDLKYYYSHGYGNVNNVKQSMAIIQDLIQNFEDKYQNKSGPKGVFYFGHTNNVLNVIVGLGYAKDTIHLTDTNFASMKDRKWRTSYLDPFSSNIRAVLYKCENEVKVTFFINDAPMYVEQYDCILCSWDSIKQLLDSQYDQLIHIYN